jgi:hypothetical protein
MVASSSAALWFRWVRFVDEGFVGVGGVGFVDGVGDARFEDVGFAGGFAEVFVRKGSVDF